MNIISYNVNTKKKKKKIQWNIIVNKKKFACLGVINLNVNIHLPKLAVSKPFFLRRAKSGVGYRGTKLWKEGYRKVIRLKKNKKYLITILLFYSTISTWNRFVIKLLFIFTWDKERRFDKKFETACLWKFLGILH